MSSVLVLAVVVVVVIVLAVVDASVMLPAVVSVGACCSRDGTYCSCRC